MSDKLYYNPVLTLLVDLNSGFIHFWWKPSLITLVNSANMLVYQRSIEQLTLKGRPESIEFMYTSLLVFALFL